MHQSRKHLGFSLLEILMSLCFASLMLSMLIQYAGLTQRHHETMQKLLEKLFDVHFLTDYLQNNIREAGFSPCGNVESLTTLDRRNGHALKAIEIKHGVSDSLDLSRMREDFGEVIQVLNDRQMLVHSAHRFNLDEPILIADCYHAEVQNVVEVQDYQEGLMITTAQPFIFDYHVPIYLGGWLQQHFWITSRQGKSSFFYKHQHTDKLTSIIQKMSFNLRRDEKSAYLETSLELIDGEIMKFLTRVRS